MRQVVKGNRMTSVRPLHSTFEADKCDRLKVAKWTTDKDVESDVSDPSAFWRPNKQRRTTKNFQLIETKNIHSHICEYGI